MIRPRSALIVPNVYDDATSIVQYEPSIIQELSAQTIFMQTRASNNAGTVKLAFGNCDSGSINGVRLQNSVSGTWTFGADCTGGAGVPNRRSSASIIVVGNVQNVAATWNGGLAQTDINVYTSENGAPIALDNGTGVDGAGAIKPATGQPFVIGNRPGGLRPWAGAIFVCARWNRVLSLDELLKVQFYGPMSVQTGMVFGLFADQARVFRDFSRYRYVPSIVTNIAKGGSSPYATPIPPRVLQTYTLGQGGSPPVATGNAGFVGAYG